jgi:transcriptional regulator with XRE-family HTH domain
MNGEPSAFGDRLCRYRERAGMSRPVFGGLVGRSTEWVKAVETGRLAVPGLAMLLYMAEVLGVDDLAELTGDQSARIERFSRGEHPSVPLTGHLHVHLGSLPHRRRGILCGKTLSPAC